MVSMGIPLRNTVKYTIPLLIEFKGMIDLSDVISL